MESTAQLGPKYFERTVLIWVTVKQKKVELEEEEINPNVEDPELKMSEMIKLFGEPGAHEILAMETEMQLKFEKVKDAQSAKLWPCLPINMKFDF